MAPQLATVDVALNAFYGAPKCNQLGLNIVSCERKKTLEIQKIEETITSRLEENDS